MLGYQRLTIYLMQSLEGWLGHFWKANALRVGFWRIPFAHRVFCSFWGSRKPA